MATTNYNLPTITGNMTADVVRDMNALAEATDGALKGLGAGKADNTDFTQLQTQVTTHLDENISSIRAASRSLSVTGTQTVIFDRKIKSAQVHAFITGTKCFSIGFVELGSVGIIQTSYASNNDGIFYPNQGRAITVRQDGNNIATGEVSVNNNVMTINWTHVSGSPNADVTLMIEAGHHGGNQ